MEDDPIARKRGPKKAEIFLVEGVVHILVADEVEDSDFGTGPSPRILGNGCVFFQFHRRRRVHQGGAFLAVRSDFGD
jgi:hypothetical protein